MLERLVKIRWRRVREGAEGLSRRGIDDLLSVTFLRRDPAAADEEMKLGVHVAHSNSDEAIAGNEWVGFEEILIDRKSDAGFISDLNRRVFR
jgi:hypothetical protein